MADHQGDVLWDRFVTVMLAAGPAQERGSRYGDKPTLFAGHREIAHLEAPGVIDLRITRAGWSRVGADSVMIQLSGVFLRGATGSSSICSRLLISTGSADCSPRRW